MRTKGRRWSLAAAALLVACSGKGKKKAEEETGVAEPPAVSDAGSSDARARMRSPVPTVTAEQRKAYTAHLAAGRKLARHKKWGEATREFELALEAVPMDARGLSELGWAAFQAGDYDKARQANADSVRVAVEPSVKAASLYNLGRVAEAVGERAEAARLYRDSLKARRSDEVRKRLEDLGKEPPAPARIAAEYLPCSNPVPRAQVCPCLVAAEGKSMLRDSDGGGSHLACATEARAIAGLEIAVLSSQREEVFFLLGRSSAGWATIARLGRTYNPGKFGINEDYRITKVEPRSVGGRRVLSVEGHYLRSNVDALVGEEERREQHIVTLCVVPEDEAEPIRCPLQFPVVDDYLRRRFEDDLAEEVEDLATPNLPIEIALGLRVDFKADGTVTLILAEGEKTDRIAPYLGPHKLW